MPQRQHDACTVPGCGRPHKAQGYCQTHYMQFRRGAPLDKVIKTRDRTPHEHCSEPGCTDPVKAKGLCKMHYARLLRHGYTGPRPRTKPRKPCSVPGCEHHVYSSGLCNRHYMRAAKCRKYGLTVHGYLEMAQRQNFVCAICAKPERAVDGASQQRRELALDHCHGTGKIRGLLCSSCNRGLGLFADDPALLREAADYLDRHRE